VSAAIARVARSIGFHVTVVDDRAPFATRERHPDAHETRVGSFDELARAIAPAEGEYVVVVTRGHDQDGDVLRALHASGCRPRWLGMIGSKAKRAQVFDQLRQDGVPDEFLARVRTPMGLPIGALSHEEIAVSVAAEMVQVRRLGRDGEGNASDGLPADARAGAR
jgi:xanthine dehydrogenase accessory factor